MVSGEKEGVWFSKEEVKDMGIGVHAAQMLFPKQAVLEYSGELIAGKLAKRKHDEYSCDPKLLSYIMELKFKSKGFAIDATKDDGRLQSLVHHSAQAPNLMPKVEDVDGSPSVILSPTRVIEVGV